MSSIFEAFVSGVKQGMQSNIPNAPKKDSASEKKTGVVARETIKARCEHNDKPTTADDVLEHVGNGEYGSAWRDWCDMTRSDTDPVTGESRTDGGAEHSEKSLPQQKNQSDCVVS